MAAISLLDLPAAQAERVEELSGMPVDEWGDGAKVRLLRAALAVAEHPDDEKAQAASMEASASMSLGDLIDQVKLSETAPEGPGEPT